MPEQYLVLYDADRIKEYVFATGRLKEIRGASEQVRRLTDQRLHAVTKWRPDSPQGLIYAGGAAGALVFQQRLDADAFCQTIERDYRRATGGATLSAVVEVVADESVAAQAIAQQRAAQALARRKASRAYATAMPGGGVLRFCDSDRLNAASSYVREIDNSQGAFVSEATAIKQLRNRDYRTSFERGAFWRRFKTLLPANALPAWRAAISPSQDLDSIGSQAQAAGYVALVYADGDRIGATLRSVVESYGFDGYQKFSDALTIAAVEATAQALAQAYASYSPVPSHLPFEVISIGGDDVILLCTAERAFTIACDLSRLFGEVVQQTLVRHGITLPAPVSASVGIVIAHDSLPIVQMERRGRDLLRSAKRASNDGLGGVDFHMVSTPTLDNIDMVRARDYSVDVGRTALTMRPYRRDQAELLLRAARHLRGLCNDQGISASTLPAAVIDGLPHLPNSKRADLYTACRGTMLQATLDVLTVHTQLADREREALLTALNTLGCLRYYPFSGPDDQGVFHTALPDILELMEFVAEEDKV